MNSSSTYTAPVYETQKTTYQATSINNPAFSTLPTQSTTTYEMTAAPVTTSASSTTKSGRTGNTKAKALGMLNRVIDKVDSKIGSNNGQASFRSDPLGGYTINNPDGSYEKKHKFTRRITRRGPSVNLMNGTTPNSGSFVPATSSGTAINGPSDHNIGVFIPSAVGTTLTGNSIANTSSSVAPAGSGALNNGTEPYVLPAPVYSSQAVTSTSYVPQNSDVAYEGPVVTYVGPTTTVYLPQETSNYLPQTASDGTAVNMNKTYAAPVSSTGSAAL